MASQYCAHCGYKNDYSTTKPKFCGNCGQPFESAFRAIAQEQTAPPYVPQHQTSAQNLVYRNDPWQNPVPVPIQIPTLSPDAFSAHSDNGSKAGSKFKLTRENLENVKDVTFDRPARTSTPSFGGEEFKSTAAETEGLYDRVRAEAQAREQQAAQSAQNAAVVPRANSRKKRSAK